jgi:microcystin-dependent protein
MSNLPQENTYNQYSPLDGSTTTFVYSFTVPTISDIAVYVTPPNVAPNPVNDLKVYGVDYTLTGVGNIGGGTVVFNTAPAISSTLTIVRSMEFSLNTQFADARNFNGQTLDNTFQRVELQMQQLASNYNFRALQYILNSNLPQDAYNIAPTSNKLPPLTDADNQVWVSQGGQIIAASIETNPDLSLLRSELASQTQLAPGTNLVGYYDTYNNVPQTLTTFLNNLPTFIVDIVSAFVPNVDYVTGDIKHSFNSVPPMGWILYKDGTIGNTGSNATTYADPSASVLFALFWDYPAGVCPIFDSAGAPSTRGVSAGADFSALKKIQLPWLNGRVVINQEGATVLNPAFIPGGSFGEGEHTLIENEMPAHTHNIADQVKQYNGGGTVLPPIDALQKITLDARQFPVTSYNAKISTLITNAPTGGGLPHNNIQPSTATYVHIKL